MKTELPEASAPAVKLFACFSRFEFALKESGYVKKGKYGGAEPDWDKFSRLDCLPVLMKRLRDSRAAPELFAHPPQKQMFDGGYLKWAEAVAITDPKTFIDAIKRVRNNLFHGGKAGDVANPRDDVLCNDAVACLVAMLELDQVVSNAFQGRY